MCSVTIKSYRKNTVDDYLRNYNMYISTACNKLFLFVKSTVFMDCLNLSVLFNNQMSFGRRFQ